MKQFLPPFLRRCLRSALERSGYCLLNRGEWGLDWVRNVATLCGQQPPNLIFDVGANQGQCLRRLQRIFPRARYHAFEPFPEAFNVLKQNAATWPNVVLHALALGDADGEKTLHLYRRNDINSLLPAAPSLNAFSPPHWTDPAGTLTVPVRRLDTFCAEQQIERIDLLKVDSQGYELRILQGAERLLQQRRIRLLLLEVLFVPLYEGQAYFHQVYQHLWERDYRLAGLYDINRSRDGAATWADALFIGSTSTPSAQA